MGKQTGTNTDLLKKVINAVTQRAGKGKVDDMISIFWIHTYEYANCA